MKKFLSVIIICFSLNAFSQIDPELTIDPEEFKRNIEFLADLNEKGMEAHGDTIKLGKEFRKLLTDSNYRSEIYPENYTWEQTVQYIQDQELKKAFWFLINLYSVDEKNKELVLKSVLTYDQILKMDDIMINTFNTYSYADPQISEIKDNRPEITRPDIFEAKLRDVQEIVNYIHQYRESHN